MMTDVENGRLYLPAENETKPNERTALHPETNSEQVLMDDDGTNLKEYLGAQVIVSPSTKKPDRPCLWAKVVSTRDI